MNDIKTVVVYAVGAIMTLLAPIQNFMYAMLILFGFNFFFGLIAARVKEEKWNTKKALMFFVYVAIFLMIASMSFVIGHLMGEHEQAVAVVKILCYIAVYIFGTNIFRNLRHIAPKDTAWYKLFDLCYYTLSVKFIEKFDFVKKWREEVEQENHNTILDKDNN
jgi:peptidoglycan/LPS O-acetylase OafA/YrhL